MSSRLRPGFAAVVVIALGCVVFSAVSTSSSSLATVGESRVTNGAVSAQAMPDNDNFADAATLAGDSGFVDGSTTDATLEVDEPEHSGSGGSVWWKWTAPVDGNLELSGRDPSSSAIFDVYGGSEFASLERIGAEYASLTVRVAAGTEYRIAVTTVEPQDVSIVWSMPSVQPNDDFADATSIVGASGTSVGSIAGSTLEANEPAHSGSGGSLWWKWTAPANGDLLIVPSEGDIETIFDVYVGSELGSLVHGGAGDWAEAIPVTAGTTYRIAITAPNQDDVSFEWSMHEPPLNDGFGAAWVMGGASGGAEGSTLGATLESGEPEHTLVGGSVWWKWTAPEGGNLVLDGTGSDTEPAFDVYAGTTIETLTESGADFNLITLPIESGVDYRIAVTSTRPGLVSFDWSMNTSPSNDPLTDAILLNGKSGAATGTTVGATLEPNEPAPIAFGGSVWWRWTAPGAGFLDLSDLATDSPAGYDLYTGSDLDSLEHVWSGLDTVNAPVKNGRTYWIAATTWQPGPVEFNWTWRSLCAADGSHEFNDVPAGTWYEQPVVWLVANDITSGTSATTYSPSQPVTRDRSALGRSASGRFALYRFASGRFASVRFALARFASVRFAPGRFALVRFALVRFALVRSAPVRSLPPNERPERSSLGITMPLRSAPYSVCCSDRLSARSAR